MAKPLNQDLDFPVPKDYQADFDEAREGIRNPQIVTLKEGERLFRVASSVGRRGAVSRDQMLVSPWWWREQEWNKVQAWIDELHGYNPGEAFRPLGAVLYEWSRCDRMLSAVVGQDIRVFSGPGQFQFEQVPGGPRIVYQPASDLLQTYVPRIVDRPEGRPPTLNERGRQVITDPGPAQAIDSHDDLDLRSLPAGTLVTVPGTRWLN